MQVPLVTIVLPTYNRAAMLGGAVDACLSQTWQNLELIVVDDASSDDTRAQVEARAHRDSRVRYIRNQENRRLPASLNVGFRAAKGDYLTWTSDDNFYRPNAIQRLVETLESRPDISLVYSDYTLIDGEGTHGDTIRVREPEDILLSSIVGACFLYRRIVQEEVGLYAEDRFLVEDYEYWLRVCRRFKALALHEDLYLYRRHGDSLTDTQKPLISQMARETLAAHIPHYLSAPRRFGARARLICGRRSMDAGDVAGARRLLAGALAKSPTEPFRFDARLVAQAVLGLRWFEQANGLRRRLMGHKAGHK